MKSRGLVATLVALSFGVFAGTAAPAARAVDPYVVDIQECARKGGHAMVPAGVPVSVQNFAFVTDVRPQRDFLLKQVTSQGVSRAGTADDRGRSDEWSEPEQIGDGPAGGWVTRLPNIELDPLAPDETVSAEA